MESMSKRDRELQAQTKEVYQSVSSLINCFDISTISKFFAEEVVSDHRTLQQNFMNCIIATLKKWKEMYDKEWYDLRNEETVKMAKRMIDALDGNTTRSL